MSKRILSKYDLNTDLGREKAIGEALEYGDSLDNPREAAGVLDGLSGALNLNDDILAEEYKKLHEKKATERLNDGIKDAARQAQKIIGEGEPEKAVTGLQVTMADLQTNYWRAKEPEQVKLDDFLAAKKNRDAERNAGDRIGFALQDFAEIDRELLGLQSGLYIIAADPNIGKTALLVSLMIDVLNSNADASCLFYSMDDSRDMIVNRLLAHLADMRINDVRFKMADDRQKQLLENAYQLLTRWFQEGRIDIREGSDFLTMSRINSEIRRHDNREKLVVFIDGLYNVPLETAHDSIRVENIERANQVKQLVRSFKVPVIATAEFRKQGREESAQAKKERTLHDIMETGKYGYNADLAILLSPKDVEAYREQDEPIIVADFSKNKLESFRGSMEFKFIRAKSVMMLVAGSKQNQ
jgi:replicative DNA helicase